MLIIGNERKIMKHSKVPRNKPNQECQRSYNGKWKSLRRLKRKMEDRKTNHVHGLVKLLL